MKRSNITALICVCICAILLLASLIERRQWGLEGRFYANDSMAGEPVAIRSGSLPLLQGKEGRQLTGVSVYSIIWKGWIAIPRTGLYRFATNSDDGSKLRIDGILVVDNGGSHGLRRAEGEIRLEQGLHEIEIRYVQYGGFSVMQTLWRLPEGDEESLPSYRLFAERPKRVMSEVRFVSRYVPLVAGTALVVLLGLMSLTLIRTYRQQLTLFGQALARVACVPSNNHEHSYISVPRTDRIVVFLAGFVLLLPFLVAIGVFLQQGFPDIFFDGDSALLEIAVRPAAKLTQLVGPYSRFEFNHPGPFYYHLLAPLYLLTKRNSLSLSATVILINAVALMTMLLILRRHAKRWLSLWFMLLMAGYLRQYFWVMLSVWNPFIAISPFFLSMLCFAMIAIGRFSLFPIAVIAASFATQTHLAFIPATVFIAVSSLAFGWLHVWSGNAENSAIEMKKYIELGMLITLLLWALPIIEEFTHSPGNLSKMFTVFSSDRELRSWSDSFDIACSIFSHYAITAFSPAFPMLSDDEQWRVIPTVVAILQFLLLPIIIIVGRRRGQPLIAAFAVCAMLLSLVMLTSIRSIIGQVYNYLVLWMTTIGMMIWLPCGELFLNCRKTTVRPIWKRVGEYGILIIFIGMQWQTCIDFATEAKKIVENRYVYEPNFRNIAIKTLDAFQQRGMTECHIAIFEPEAWPVAVGLATQLDKIGIRISVDAHYAFQFPQEFRGALDSKHILYVVSQATGTKLEEKFVSEIELIAKVSEIKVLIRQIK